MSDDIHDKEQRNEGPMIEPELTNKELGQYDYKNLGDAMDAPISKVDDSDKELSARASLQKRAWDFVHQHRPELNKKNPHGAPASSGGSAKDRHRGVVTDPDTDMRLKENKDSDNDDSGSDDADTHDSILAQKDKAEKERKMRELGQINERAGRTAGFVLKPEKKEHVPTHSFVPKSQTPEHVPTNSFVPNSKKETNPHIPQNLGNAVHKVKPVPGQSKEESEVRQHPKIGPYVNKALGPNSASPEKISKIYDKMHKASPEETTLRNDPNYGNMVCGILGEGEPTSEKLNLVRERLHKALQNSSDVKVKNAINTGISLTASIMLNMGFMKDAK